MSVSQQAFFAWHTAGVEVAYTSFVLWDGRRHSADGRLDNIETQRLMASSPPIQLERQERTDGETRT